MHSQLAGLCVFAYLPFVIVVALTRDNVVGNLDGQVSILLSLVKEATGVIVAHLIWCLCAIRTELVSEAVGRILLVSRMVCIHTYWSVEVERR